MPLQAGDKLSHYEVLAPIGKGGMGEVWKARDTRLDREVALKFLPEAATTDPASLERFVREAKAASALNHPNIITIYEINSDRNLHFIAMELVHGKALSRILRRVKRLPPAMAVNYAIQLCEGLGKAHRAGIVHRDIKPSNLMLTGDGLIKILDFGLAKSDIPDRAASRSGDTRDAGTITAVGVTMGTIQYMSPEQAAGEPASPRSDVFSIGVVLYEMVSGRRPFAGSSQLETLRALLSEDPPPLRSIVEDVPPELARIAHTCLAKSPDERYRDALEIAGELRAMYRVSPEEYSPEQPTVTVPVPTPIRHPVRMRRRLLAGAVSLGLGLAAVAGFLAVRARRHAPESSVVSHPPSATEVFQRARAYLQRYDRKGNVARAIEDLQSTLRYDPGNSALHAALAEAYVYKYAESLDKQWLEKAIESGRRAVAANDDLAAAHVGLGMALAAGGQNNEAASELQRASELDPLSSPAYLALAKVRFTQGQVEESKRLYQKAIQLAPSDWAPLDGLAAFHFRNARYDDAIETWRKALQLAPDNVRVMVRLGAGYHAKGQYAEAASTFQRALERDPTAITWANLGTARFFQGNYADAARAMEKAAGLAPKNYLNWGNLGDCYRWAPGLRDKAARAYETGIQLARQRLALNPKDTPVRSSLAVYLAKTGDTAESLAEVAQVQQAPAIDPGTAFKIALVYELANDREKALTQLDRAIKAGYSMHEVANEPELARLRSDDRYRRIISSPVRAPR